MANRLYVSFWDLCLDTLPQGRSERRVLGARYASQMIRAAHDCRREYHAVAGGGAEAGRSLVGRDVQLPTRR